MEMGWAGGSQHRKSRVLKAAVGCQAVHISIMSPGNILHYGQVVTKPQLKGVCRLTKYADGCKEMQKLRWHLKASSFSKAVAPLIIIFQQVAKPIMLLNRRLPPGQQQSLHVGHDSLWHHGHAIGVSIGAYAQCHVG